MEARPLGSQEEVAPTADLSFPWPARWAGGGLLVASILVLIPPGKGKGGAIVDLLVGVGLLSGSSGALSFARFRAWLGLTLGTLLMLTTQGLPEAVGQVLLCVSLLLVLGRPPRRWVTGGVLMMVLLGVGSLCVYVESTGRNPVARMAYL